MAGAARYLSDDSKFGFRTFCMSGTPFDHPGTVYLPVVGSSRVPFLAIGVLMISFAGESREDDSRGAAVVSNTTRGRVDVVHKHLVSTSSFFGVTVKRRVAGERNMVAHREPHRRMFAVKKYRMETLPCVWS